ncbi:MAG: putative lipoprotein [Spirochaetia bacterium]|nr:putative lipoprotein [Spirochaetia bacterium]
MLKFLFSLSFLFYYNCAVFSSISQSSQSVQSVSTSLSSISTSLNSISSISSSLGSISKSSSSDKKEKEANYQKDVKDLTYLFVKSNEKSDFTSEIRNLAYKYGYYDWKNNESTYIGIGQGLKKAGVSQKEFLEVSKGISNHKQQSALLQAGFNS